ncbi:MAG: glycoside hydrolase family 9 protein [Bacteroidota bacterium]
MLRFPLLLGFLLISCVTQAQQLELNDQDYFHTPGMDVMLFADYYPDGHQTGVTIVQHGRRVAANGDLRLEASPGQWSPVPKAGPKTVDREAGVLTQRMWYPDSSKNGQGFNPINYPDLHFAYEIRVEAVGPTTVKVTVDLDEPLPQEWVGKVGFNFELFPTHLFGLPWQLDQANGLFPRQADGVAQDAEGRIIASPLASGHQLEVAPGRRGQHLIIESEEVPLELLDGRGNHNNGWYIVRSLLPAGVSENALSWTIEAKIDPDWLSAPVLQLSQLGYHPRESKFLIIEQDPNDPIVPDVGLEYYKPEAEHEVIFIDPAEYRPNLPRAGSDFNSWQYEDRLRPEPWGRFLRYQYYRYDFSHISRPGLYRFRYRGQYSRTFRIDPDLYTTSAWQPVMEYFLPVQMCHMRVNEKYRVWHDYCHLDDARMAPTDLNHFDGYKQGTETLTDFQAGDPVPGLNQGGWHDAGDYDLRVESQINTIRRLALMVEEFGISYDATTIDQEQRLVEIHQPDGQDDFLQQIEHGLLTVLGGYRSLGRLYRGIICPDLRQYVMLGDGAAMTDNLVYNPAFNRETHPAAPLYSGWADDRWVFTEDNPDRELIVAAGLATAARVLRSSNPELSRECLEVAEVLYRTSAGRARRVQFRLEALAELILATEAEPYLAELISLRQEVEADIANSGWALGRCLPLIKDEAFISSFNFATYEYLGGLNEAARTDSPYGVPYKPNIWGAGWNIQAFGVKLYFWHQAFPDFQMDRLMQASLQFILGVHPGENTASLASGIGSNSVTVAYGVNRADWSYIPGGVASGTALIRPDLPEMKEWPFFWQQTEYVMGGGATNYLFLVLAAEHLLNTD